VITTVEHPVIASAMLDDQKAKAAVTEWINASDETAKSSHIASANISLVTSPADEKASASDVKMAIDPRATRADVPLIVSVPVEVRVNQLVPKRKLQTQPSVANENEGGEQEQSNKKPPSQPTNLSSLLHVVSDVDLEQKTLPVSSSNEPLALSIEDQAGLPPEKDDDSDEEEEEDEFGEDEQLDEKEVDTRDILAEGQQRKSKLRALQNAELLVGVDEESKAVIQQLQSEDADAELEAEDEEDDEDYDPDNDDEESGEGDEEDDVDESKVVDVEQHGFDEKGEFVRTIDDKGKPLKLRLLTPDVILANINKIRQIGSEATPLVSTDLVYLDEQIVAGEPHNLAFDAQRGVIVDAATGQVAVPYEFALDDNNKLIKLESTWENSSEAVFTNYSTLRKAVIRVEEERAFFYSDCDFSLLTHCFELPINIYRYWSRCICCSDKYLAIGLSSYNAVLVIDLVNHTQSSTEKHKELRVQTVSNGYVLSMETLVEEDGDLKGEFTPFNAQDVALVESKQADFIFTRTGSRVRCYRIPSTLQTPFTPMHIKCPELTNGSAQALKSKAINSDDREIDRLIVLVNDTRLGLYATMPARQFCLTAKTSESTHTLYPCRMFVTPQYFIGVNPSVTSEYLKLCRISLLGSALPISYYRYLDELRARVSMQDDVKTNLHETVPTMFRYGDMLRSINPAPEAIHTHEQCLSNEHLFAIYKEALEYANPGNGDAASPLNQAIYHLLQIMTSGSPSAEISPEQETMLRLVRLLFASPVSPYKNVAKKTLSLTQANFVSKEEFIGPEMEIVHFVKGLIAPYIAYTAAITSDGNTVVVCADTNFISAYRVSESKRPLQRFLVPSASEGV
jgi:hypothetical protein